MSKPSLVIWSFIYLKETYESDRERSIWYCLYVESKKNVTNELYVQNRNRVTDVENKLIATKGESGKGGKNWETVIDICLLLYIR